MRKQNKTYSRPWKPFDSDRIKAENKLKTRYGLKNKKEIWKSDAKIKIYRTRAKSLITADREIQKQFFDKLNQIGLNVDSVADVLALTVEDILKRRLSTIVAGKKLADTAKQARQMIVHRRIIVDGKVVSVPSYLVRVDEEPKVCLKKKVKKAKPEVDETPEVIEDVVEAPVETPAEEKVGEVPVEKVKGAAE